MTRGTESLPQHFPIFPLAGALLLPGGNLPLNIFEPRYLQMVRDAMQTDRIIGMVQPLDAEEEAEPRLYRTGCAGRISNFSETEDGRYLITLTGVARFDIARELEVETPYRQIEADFERWRDDRKRTPPPDEMRDGLLETLEAYFAHEEIEADWKAIRNAPLGGLVISLAMICPFEANEKQALLEAPTLEEQCRLLITLMQMTTRATEDGEASIKH